MRASVDRRATPARKTTRARRMGRRGAVRRASSSAVIGPTAAPIRLSGGGVAPAASSTGGLLRDSVAYRLRQMHVQTGTPHKTGMHASPSTAACMFDLELHMLQPSAAVARAALRDAEIAGRPAAVATPPCARCASQLSHYTHTWTCNKRKGTDVDPRWPIRGGGVYLSWTCHASTSTQEQ
ncbi:hypothetical protein GUJ93_ZPchr0006g46094 [Zizania palustris]|uniref:Uncharacterized protein n=1 Tax=Zizania palustris TaxID=103762 RepID=A0A8J5VWT2_ZIZPA|nr:hypothetical protein GUJ93_ZPchr0006g46094 [Zizania palustris]